jgi:hypothetical protein
MHHIYFIYLTLQCLKISFKARMNSPETLTTLNTQDTGRRQTKQINVRENQRAIKNEQSGDTDNTEHTTHRT